MEDFHYIDHVHEELVRQAYKKYWLAFQLATLTDTHAGLYGCSTESIREGEQQLEHVETLISEIMEKMKDDD